MSVEQRRQLLIELLTDRFHFQYHWETEMQTAQVLTAAKGELPETIFPPGPVIALA